MRYPVVKRQFTGMSELEEAYGMALNAPHGFEGFRDGVGQDPAMQGDVRYRQGRPVEADQLAAQSLVRDRHTAGVGQDQSAVAATRISPTVAIVTVRLGASGFRTVTVISGGRTVEMWRNPRVGQEYALIKHRRLVVKARDFLEDNGLVDPDFDEFALKARERPAQRSLRGGWVLNEHGRAVRA